MDPTQKITLEDLQQGGREAFKRLFEEYYVRLHRYVWGYVKSRAIAEEIVQDLFLKIWETRHELVIKRSLSAYLFQAARNKSIDWLRHQQVEEEWREERTQLQNQETPPDQSKRMHDKQMLKAVEEAIKSMPERRREVFMLSRYEEMTYREIAGFLDISQSTVETHMSKALEELRKKFLPLL